MVLVVGALFGFIGYFTAPWCINASQQIARWAENHAARTPASEMIPAALGVILGLIVGYLLSLPLSELPFVGHFLPILVTVLLGYIGLIIGRRKKDELDGLTALLVKVKPGSRTGSGAGSAPKILDTSVIIDGRILDVVRAGFLEGPLVVPAFVLEELRHIADSADFLKRNRGRRGLDILNRVQKELGVNVQISERDVGNLEVDSKLLRLAKIMDGKVVTNDYNLNKVASLQGVTVLNINELANAVKPVVLPGEEMFVTVIKEGKEPGQGVAYLDDGTMIVIDGGRKYIGEELAVLVTSVLQTAAGRMIFAKPKGAEKLQVGEPR